MTTTEPKQELTVSSTDDLRSRARTALENCGVDLSSAGAGPSVGARSPITGEELFDVPGAGLAEVEAAIAETKEAFLEWRAVPAPVRGAFVKRLGELLGEHKADVAELITIEAGKIRSESLGEVQEAIDICDFAVGLSRQLDGRTMPSERPGHRLMETWHPLGVVGVITAFNFPCAVWAWNAAVAFVCGDTIVWKPSPMTALTSMACQALVERAASECDAPAGVQRLVDRRPGGVPGARRQPRCRARQRHRIGAHGHRGRAARGCPHGQRSCSSSAATTPRSSRRRPISSSPSGGSPSPPREPPASAARPCVA